MLSRVIKIQCNKSALARKAETDIAICCIFSRVRHHGYKNKPLNETNLSRYPHHKLTSINERPVKCQNPQKRKLMPGKIACFLANPNLSRRHDRVDEGVCAYQERREPENTAALKLKKPLCRGFSSARYSSRTT